MISLADYWMGRDKLHAADMDPGLIANATLLLSRVNPLLFKIAALGQKVEKSPATGTLVTSGWRPASLNAHVRNAAPRSKHIAGLAIDLYDPSGDLDEFLFAHPALLADLGLWAEHPAATKGWCHLQCVPPRSGNRFFFP
jgi:hypothetical protein